MQGIHGFNLDGDLGEPVDMKWDGRLRPVLAFSQ